MQILVVAPELNRTVLTQDGMPVLFAAGARMSTTAPSRVKVALGTTVRDQVAVVAEFRLEMN